VLSLELLGNPLTPSTASAIHDDLLVAREATEVVSHRILWDELAADVADRALMRFANIEQEEILSSVEASFKFLGGYLRD
jgi:hypothetical protein